MKARMFVIAVLMVLVFGCRAAAEEGQTFTVRAAPQLEAQADLATTAHGVAQKVDQSGTPPHSADSSFLVGATGVWKNQAGPGNQLPATSATVAEQERKIADAKAQAERDAEAERQAHLAQLNELKKQNETLAGQLKLANEATEKAKADAKAALERQSLAAMWAKLLAILLVGGGATAATLFFQQTRAFAPFVAIGAAALAGIVVVRACAGDILIVIILAVVLAALYGVGMWLWEHRKFVTADKVATAQENAIEQLPDTVAPAVKAAVRVAAGDLGVQPQLQQRLIDKGYSSADATDAAAVPAASVQT